ncbi:hypothetical protein [Ferrimonas balearica]|uniref:hypothetical protein n=1 Tax=Ferrimonas balearica TaxID=44012 RepID=UPI001F28405C|nr:hypothetical protein [Ferrimonas balearica]MBY6094729.1 hypothetical protein [Ferrimonas balearica]
MNDLSKLFEPKEANKKHTLNVVKMLIVRAVSRTEKWGVHQRHKAICRKCEFSINKNKTKLTRQKQ